jgi:hypothetical protein
MKGGMPDHDLKALGEVLEQGQAGLLVVYAPPPCHIPGPM